jgi:DNA-binding NarL/FixJ family response regulator
LTNLQAAKFDERKRRIRVLCIDDHPLIREGIGAVVGNQADSTIVVSADVPPEVEKKPSIS